MSSDWFLTDKDMKEKPAKRKSTGKRFSSPVPTTCMARLLEDTDLTEEGYPKNNLYCSNIGDPEWSLSENILAFWRPTHRKKNIFSQIYMEQSTVKHQIIQDFWFDTGVLHPRHTGILKYSSGEEVEVFEEIKAYLPDYGLKGKIDLILPDEEYLKALGAKKPPALDELPERKGWRVGDIKECSEHVYKTIQDHLPEKYRTQVSIYHHWAVLEGIQEEGDPAFFYYMNRNNPRQFKWVSYTPEPELVQRAFKKADIFWEHIRNKTHPEIDDFEDYCLKSIEMQPSRKWNPLSGIETVEVVDFQI